MLFPPPTHPLSLSLSLFPSLSPPLSPPLSLLLTLSSSPNRFLHFDYLTIDSESRSDFSSRSLPKTIQRTQPASF